MNESVGLNKVLSESDMIFIAITGSVKNFISAAEIAKVKCDGRIFCRRQLALVRKRQDHHYPIDSHLHIRRSGKI